MSEYQYFEFQALDRPLTKKQMAELRRVSTRARITATSFVNEYNWGDFKGDPEGWMEKYFDAYLYLANWGSRHLMFRIPNKLLEFDIVSEYTTGECLSGHATGDHLVLSFYSEVEEYDWIEGEGWLGSLIPLRNDLMRGDYRSLYLGWLLGVQAREIDEENLEMPVPPGLADLNAPLQSLVDFLRIDPDLIAAAVEGCSSEAASGPSEEDMAKWVADLPAKEKDAFITRMLEGEDQLLAAGLRQRCLRELRGAGRPGRPGPRRWPAKRGGAYHQG